MYSGKCYWQKEGRDRVECREICYNGEIILFNALMWTHGTMHLSKTHKLYSTCEKNKNTLGTEYPRGKSDSYKKMSCITNVNASHWRAWE